MTVSLVEIFAAARAHVAPLAAESAGYLLLAVADHVALAPRVVEAGEVELSSDGSVRLGRGASTPSASAEGSVRHLLARALEVSSGVGPGLRRAADRRQDVGLSGLVRELEVALIPVNRAAAKRALSRLHRETERARDAGKLARLLRAEVEAPASTAASEPEDALVASAELPEPSLATPPVGEAPPPPVVEVAPVPRRAPPVPAVELTLTPEPRLAVGEPALTRPEPVVLRARERGGSTPRLGTIVTAQTLAGEESDLTERAPEVVEELDLSAELELPEAFDPVEEPTPVLQRVVAVEPAVVVAEPAVVAVEPAVVVAEPAVVVAEPAVVVAEPAVVVAEPAVVVAEQPWADPEPSRIPDVLTAMVELHTGFESDEAPTRLREVLTELRIEAEPAPSAAPVRLAPVMTPEPEQVEDAWLTASSLESLGPVIMSDATLFISELAEPELHDALTWNPGPVVTSAPIPLPPALLMAEPELSPSPYAPAVLPAQTSDVAELLDSFYVSGATEEQDLRSALKEMAGLELTPMPHPRVEEG
jgi:hypothetical protein